MASNGVTSSSEDKPVTGVVTGAEEPGPTTEQIRERARLQREKETGFLFVNHPTKMPLDFARDPKTGKTKDNVAVYGMKMVDLRNGIDGCDLPCVFTWKRGRWLSEFEVLDAPLDSVKPKKANGHRAPYGGWEFCVWVVAGEGMPGNFFFFAYLIPIAQAKDCGPGDPPKHPMMWPKKLKEGKADTFDGMVNTVWRSMAPIGRDAEWYRASWQLLETGTMDPPLDRWKSTSYGGGGYPSTSHKPATTTPATTTKAPALPAAARFRHVCGHWFKESELAGHAKVCGIANGGDESDFAVLCDDKCGCEMIKDFPAVGYVLGQKTLDHVAAAKPGFPRQPKEVSTTVTDEATEAGEVTQPDAPTEPETATEPQPEPETAPEPVTP